MRLLILAIAGTLVGMSGFLTSLSGALAHEHRAVAEYGFIVGFLNEPAYLNEPNGLDLTVYTVDPGVDVKTASVDQRHGVTGLDQTLKADVSVGGAAPLALTLEPRFNVPGAYNGNFFPTATGDYTFHITGTINGQSIDETFTSSPDTFASIEDPADLQYPVKVKSGQDLQAEVDALSSDKGGDSNTGPIVLAIMGIVLGAAGLGAGGFALTKRRS